jgi:hypothetical protein
MPHEERQHTNRLLSEPSKEIRFRKFWWSRKPVRYESILLVRSKVNVILFTQRKEWTIALDLRCMCLNCTALCAKMLLDVYARGDEFVWAGHGGAPLSPLL